MTPETLKKCRFIKQMTPDEVDKIPYIDERGRIINHLVNERDEQDLTRKYLPTNAQVLELGARY